MRYFILKNPLVSLYNWNALLLFASVVFLIRPLGVFLSSYKSGLKLSEKLFISWVGPRGIVAAGIASLFGLKLAKSGEPGAEYITPLVFMIVLGTVLLNATTARLFAKIVGVFLKKSEGILIIGASKVSRLIAIYLKNNQRNVVLVDSNRDNVKKAKSLGLDAIEGSIYNDQLKNNIELNDIGFLMASFRLVTHEEMSDPENNPDEGLFSHTDDYNNLINLAEKYPGIQEIKIDDKDHYNSLILITKQDEDIIPLFIKDADGNIRIISAYSDKMEEINENSFLVYMGKPIDVEEIN